MASVATLAWGVPIFASIYAVATTTTIKTLPEVVAVCVATLVIKALLIALLTVRARMIGGEAAFGGGKKEAANLLFIVFKPVLLAYEWAPALGGKAAVERLERCVRNNCEFEPLFAGLLLAASVVAKTEVVSKKGVVLQEDQTELVKSLALVATYARVLHSTFFVTWPLTGSEPRTFAFDGFFFATLGLGVYVVMIAA